MNTAHITESLNYKVTNDSFDRKLGQPVCFAAALLVFTLTYWKLARLELTEVELFFGVLLSLVTPLLLVVVGFFNDSFDRKLGLGQTACFAAALLVFTLTYWKIARLELTEVELLLGVLLSLVTPTLLVVVGLLLPGAAATKAA